MHSDEKREVKLDVEGCAVGMLELGEDKKEKRAVVVGLSVIHVGALAGIVTVFVAGLSSEMALSPMLTVVAVVATTLWLFSFILLSVNIAYYVLAPDEDATDDRSSDHDLDPPP